MTASALISSLLLALPSPAPAGTVATPGLVEASGLAASPRAHPGVLWTHNDGPDGRLFAVSTNGAALGIWKIDAPGITDVEDLAVRTTDDTEEILLADIGDNKGNRPSVRVIVVPAPAPRPPGNTLEGPALNPSAVLEFTYEDGPRDAESLAVDPATGHLLLIAKEKKTCGVYRFDPASSPAVARRIARLPVSKASGADISPDGLRLAVVNGKGAWMWTRTAGETWEAALVRDPVVLPYEPGPNGESVAWSADGRHTFTLSEGENPVLHRGETP